VRKVNRKTELCENWGKDRLFGENVQIFYVTDIAEDWKFELVDNCQRDRFRLSVKIQI
jgi:hypothetical protein